MQTHPFEKHVWAEIDLDALRHNFRAVKARAGALPLCAVVKATVPCSAPGSLPRKARPGWP